ncbi:cadherin domain protein [Teladorsagia circumcincta]|uniref:Cadherin domain protein n=1 Tax=Teladorsagia circumcincta TaxID=45464 RepID=A0A2G9UXH0_TELCI|nr:cadherin domain protein [Teladorsagia circumcincta]
MRANDSIDRPQFYNEPYHVEVNESLSVGDTVETPVVVVDWESEDSPPKLHLEDSDSPFKIVTEKRQKSPVMKVGSNKTSSREPAIVLLKLVKPITHLPMTVKLVAENSQDSASETLIHLHGKTRTDKKRAKAHSSLIQWTLIDMVDPDGTFEIRQKTGEVVIRDNRIMDRELFTNLELVAEIHGSSHLTKCARVRVNVELLDENDNRPTFEKEKYVDFQKFQLMLPGGEAGHVSYSLLNSSVPFEIRPKGKDGEIVATSEYDGSQEVYDLVVEARDNAPPFLSSQIPVDILVPKSVVSLAANKTKSKKMNGVVSATVEPSMLLQGITKGERIISKSSSSSSRKPFTTSRPRTTTTRRITSRRPTSPTIHEIVKHVHPTLISAKELSTEVKTTSTSPDFDENEEEYTDESLEEVTTVAAEVAGNPKVFASIILYSPSYYYEVFGTPQEGDILGKVEAQPNTQFYGIDRKMNGMFKIDPDIGEISVGKHAEQLDDGNHTFEVSATNGLHTAHTVVTVRLDSRRGRTEGVPRFERNRYVFSIPENRPPSVVGVVRDLCVILQAYHVALSSDDVSLQYELLPGSFSASSLPFRVHPISGEITSEALLDHETNKNYEFKVGSQLASEFDPAFQCCPLQIRACLSVNPSTCGYTAVVVIVTDVNDNAPRFSASQFHISLPSDLPVGSDVITLQATDADSGINGDVNYAINPPSAVFGIDYHTGVVQTIAALTESHYELNIEAFDHGDPKQTSVARLSIAVHGTNPSAPFFDKKHYKVTLNSPIRAGAVVAELHARDPDPGLEGQITYRFEYPADQLTEDRKFSINEQTGVVSALAPLTAQDGPFDLLVIAEDQSTVFKRKTSAILHIEIVGDTSLRFLPLPSTIYISTEKAVGSVVLRASAFTSSALPVHFRILENESQFVMDGDLLRVANHLSPGETHLTIRAESDNAHSDHQLRVVVMFDRDKYPVFPQLTYDIDGELSASASYAQTPANHDTQFVVVRAVNLDYPDFYSDVGVFPKSSSVMYSISPGAPLSILPNGTLVVNSPIDLEQLPVDQAENLYFVVTARVGEAQVSTKVQLKVKDLNEFTPEFERKQYDVSISESAGPGSTIVKVEATDADKTEGTHLLYKVVGGEQL